MAITRRKKFANLIKFVVGAAGDMWYRASDGQMTALGGTKAELKVPAIQTGAATVAWDYPRALSGTGSPEGVVTAGVGTGYIQTDAAVGSKWWVKQSGTGNTGWEQITGGGGGGGLPVTTVTITGTLWVTLSETGESGAAEIPIDDGWTIAEAEIIGDVSGSAVVDVQRATDAGFPTFASIAASAKPTLSSEERVKDAVLTGWTKTLVAGDTLKLIAESMSTLTKVTVGLKVTKEIDVSVSAPRLVSIVRTFVISGQVYEVPVDVDGTVQKATLLGDAAGTCSMETYRATDAGFGTFTRIDGGVAESLSGTQRVVDSTLAGWTPDIAAGDTLKFRLASMQPGLTRVTFALTVLVGSLPGASGGFTGALTTGAIPRVTGATTLGDSSASDDGNAFATSKGRRRAVAVKSADYTTTAQDDVVWVTGVTTITLVEVSSHPKGHQTIVNAGSDDVTVTPGGTDTLYLVGVAGSITLEPGDSVDVINNGADAEWRAI